MPFVADETPHVFSVPPALQRLADQIDGWLDLRCPDRAISLLEPLLADPAARAAGLAMRVRALVSLGRYRDALPDLAELRIVAPADDWVDLTEAFCRKRTGDLPGAIRCLEALLSRDHRHDVAHFNLACYLSLSGDRDRAIDALTIACGLNEECRDFARDDPDLDPLRTDPRFRQLLRAGPPAMGDTAIEVDDEAAVDGEDDGADGDPRHN